MFCLDVNNRFFFVVREKSSETYFVYVINLIFKLRENQWFPKVRSIHISTTGSIIAVVKDQGYPKEIDSYWTYKNDLKLHKDNILNQIFLLDSQNNLVKLRQDPSQKKHYRQIKKIDLQ